MSYPLSATLLLGAGNSGLTLSAALFDSADVAAPGLVTTTLMETDAGTGIYLWTGTIPNGHRGLIKFSSGAVVKTAISINPEELETAAVVWSYTPRTLSAVAVTPPSTLTGARMTLLRGETLIIPFTGLGDLTGASKIWFTLKETIEATDDEATVRVTSTGGLERLNGAAASSVLGSLTVNNVLAGNITVRIEAGASDDLIPGRHYSYDVQTLTGTTVSTRTFGQATITADVTQAIL